MHPIEFHSMYDASVSLSRNFVDRYMPACTPVYALIYIYGLRHASSGGKGLSTQEIGEAFNILETDVLNAWKYWETKGLIKMDSRGDEGLFIKYLPLTEEIDNSKTDKEVMSEKSADKPVNAPIFNVSLRPNYTVEELSFYQKQSKGIERLFSHGEQTLGKMLTYHDMNVLFGFYDWLRLPMDVIIYMLSYCADGNHRDLRYIEKVALDWAERGISTVDDAKAYTQTFDKEFRAVMTALGHPSAFPSPTQRKYMQKWLNEMDMPLELVVEACDKTAVQIGKPKLTYIDKIITDWHKKGMKSLEAVAAAEANWQKSEKASEEDRTRSPVKQRNRFANFKSRERDYAQIERMEQEYQDKKYGGI